MIGTLPFSISQELIKKGVLPPPRKRHIEILFINSPDTSTSTLFNIHNEDRFMIPEETAKGRILSNDILWKTSKSMSLNLSDKGMRKTDITDFTVPTGNILPTIDSVSMEWIQKFNCSEPLKYMKNWYMYNHIVLKISSEDEVIDFFGLLNRGVTKYIYEMQNSSKADHLRVLNRFLRAQECLGRIRDIGITRCVIPQISSRIPMTGELKKLKTSITLVSGKYIKITLDRKYAQRGTRKRIYINCRNILKFLKLRDAICIGKIRLSVYQIFETFLWCKIICGGDISPGMPVQFGRYKISEDELTPEVIEDINFIRENALSYFVLPEPVTPAYYENIRKAFLPTNINTMKVLCRVHEKDVADKKLQYWLIQNCAGVIIIISNRFSDETKSFIDLLYERKRAIILSSYCLDKCIKTDFLYNYYYADCYFVDELPEKLCVYQKLFNENQPAIEEHSYKALLKGFVDRSSIGSDCMARSIVKLSYEMNAKAILVCSTSGRMAIKLSHYRPKCPIIVISNNPAAVKALQIFHNIVVAYYIESTELSLIPDVRREDFLLRRLASGLYFGVVMRYLKNQDTVIFCFKILPDNGYANKIVVFELNADVANLIYTHIQ